MKLGDLFDDGVPADAAGLEITGLTADSRKVKPGYLFAALKGVAAHGRDFVAQAKANGAVAVLSGKRSRLAIPSMRARHRSPMPRHRVRVCGGGFLSKAAA
jgi:UDP-N-acetylmuramoyl-L-alanyl-D-glutamate--2,6-diaminopimelate ligase